MSNVSLKKYPAIKLGTMYSGKVISKTIVNENLPTERYIYNIDISCVLKSIEGRPDLTVSPASYSTPSEESEGYQILNRLCNDLGCDSFDDLVGKEVLVKYTINNKNPMYVSPQLYAPTTNRASKESQQVTTEEVGDDTIPE